MIRRAMKLAVGIVAATAFVAGVSVFFAPPATAGRLCICPDVYAPVTCSNGITYSNKCVASCQHATGCVPAGNI